MMIKKIFIDAGHGGSDPGAIGNGLIEKNLTLQMAMKVGNMLLHQYECEVGFSRVDDTTTSLSKRVDLAVKFKADLFLSLHTNAHHTEPPNGYEDFVHPHASDTSRKYRSFLHNQVGGFWTVNGRANRGMKEANFFVLRATPMPAVLLENGFASNVRDASLLRDAEFTNILADRICLGVAQAMDLPGKHIPEKSDLEHLEHHLREAMDLVTKLKGE